MVRKKYATISPRLSAYLCIMHQVNGVAIRQLAREHRKYSLATIFRHCTKPIHEENERGSNGKKNVGGRPTKLTLRDKRKLDRAVQSLRRTDPNCTSMRIQLHAGLNHISNRTVRHHLNQLGYKYLQTRKKGLLLKSDYPKRVRFAKMMLKTWDEDVWKKDVAFYLDGSSFAHKNNPADQARAPGARIWRRKCEGLKRGCTSKGKKVGSGGKVAHFFVCISYGKGVCYVHQYEKLNGINFATFVKEHFKCIFERSCNPEGNMFIQDGDPSQNSKLAKIEMGKLNVIQLPIPARSPDMNPIENVFHLAECTLKSQALQRNITHECYADFCQRVTTTLFEIPVATVDAIIDSMGSRMKEVVKRKGERLRY